MSPETCDACASGNVAQQSSKKKLPKSDGKKSKKDKLQGSFDSLPFRHVGARDVVVELEAYQYSVKENFGSRQIVTRQVHLERHLESSPHALTDPAVAKSYGMIGPKSPSSLVDSRAGVQELLVNVATFASLTDSRFIREYWQRERIVRITFTGNHDGLEVSILERVDLSSKFRLISSYDGISVNKVECKLRREWTLDHAK
ncbi:hypothetical protein QMK34_23145 [Amycolatopsis sp. H20-H5]|nr:hypothetical protein [Amycolatopsis sp. H20-H5]